MVLEPLFFLALGPKNPVPVTANFPLPYLPCVHSEKVKNLTSRILDGKIRQNTGFVDLAELQK